MTGTAGAQEADRAAPTRALPLGGRGKIVVADLLGVQTTGGVTHFAGVGGVGAFRTGPFFFAVASGESRRPDGTILTSRSTHVGFAPSLDVFVTERVSVGGRAHVDFFSSRYDGAGGGAPESSGHAVGFWPRVGYAVPLTSSLALWPRLELGGDVTRQGFSTGERTLYRRWGGALDLGVVARVSELLIVDLGPRVSWARTDQDGGPWSPGSMSSEVLSGGARASLSLIF